MASGAVTIEIPQDHADALLRLKERRDREPLLFCKWIARWPLQSFLITLSGHVLMLIISVSLLAGGYDLLPIDFENLPLEINDQPWRPRDLAWHYRDTFSTYYDRTPLAGYRANSYYRADVDLYYDADGGNIFTKENLEIIQNIENTLTSIPKYNASYCQLDSTLTVCQEPTSVIRFFDGSMASVNAAFNDPSFNNIPAILYAAYSNNATSALFQFFLGRSHSITNESAFSTITRSRLPLGFPFQQYSDVDAYEDDVQEFSASYLKPVLADFREDIGAIDFSYFSYLLWADFVFGQAMKDVLCAIGSICFIFVFILIHTKSLWITGFAIFSILTSFLCTNLIYRVVLDYRYIGFFHVLTIFIILGIGADDVFVFYDVWRNTAFEEYKSLAHRMSDAYRKSVFSMFFTSITTAAAFFASAISPLLATQSFGVFSGLVIIVNYISVIVYFPTVIMVYHTKFEQFKWPCILFCKRTICKRCCPPHSQERDTNKIDRKASDHSVKYDNTHAKYVRQNSVMGKPNEDKVSIQNGSAPNGFLEKKSASGTTKEQAGINAPIITSSDGFIRSVYDVNDVDSTKYVIDPPLPVKSNGYVKEAFTNGHVNGGFNIGPGDQANGHIQNKSGVRLEEDPKIYGTAKKRKQKSMMVHFFKTKYFSFVTHKYIRWVILAVMAGFIVFFSYQASKLEPDNESLKVLKDDHVYSISAEHQTSSFVFSSSDRTVPVFIVWGMLPNDLSSCHFSTPKCLGDKVWDDAFDPSTPTAQTAMMDFCDTLKSLSSDQANDLRIRKDYLTGDYEVGCYIDNLATFLNEETVSTSTNWNLTYDYNKAVSFMSSKPEHYNSTLFNSSYEDFLEIPISYWLSNKYTFDHTNDFFVFNHLIGEEIGTFSQPLNNSASRKYGNNIKYIGIQVNTTMRIQNLGYSEGIPIKDRWEEFVTNQMQKMPAGINNGYQTTRQLWHWLLVQEMLARNAIYGIVIGVCLAFPILTIATRNIITGSLATFSMLCSTVCVIGVIPLGGWKLGVLVSLNMCMVVGLTVDYVVHLAEGYTLSLHNDRLNRVRDMLDEMAVSVFFGACTTLGASTFMFLAQLSFFLQFGIFMFSTVGFSLFFSMGMFVTLMGIVGPENNTGNIVSMAKRLGRWCKGNKGSKVTDGQGGTAANSSATPAAAVANTSTATDRTFNSVKL